MPTNSEELKSGEWFLSGGNGVITLCEFGNAEPITYLRADQKAIAGYIVRFHNESITRDRQEHFDEAIALVAKCFTTNEARVVDVVKVLEAARDSKEK